MSVESVERNANMAESKSAREAYDEREKEIVSRHRRELSELKNHHQDAMSKLKNSYEQEMNAIRDDSREMLSEKEKKHLREIQDVQSVNRKRLEKTREEGDDKYNATKSNLEGELARTKEQDQQRANRLNKNFDHEISRRDLEAKDTELKTREGSQEALRDQTKRLQDKFDEERDYYRSYIKKRNQETGESYNNLNQSKDAELAETKRTAEAQKKRLETKYTSSLQHERDQYNKSVKDLEDGFQAGMVNNKDKFHKRAEQLTEEFHDNFEDLKTTTAERVDRQVESVRQENYALKNQNEIDKHTNIQQKQREKQNLGEEFQKNYEELETRRLGSVKDAQVDKIRHVERLQRNMDKNYSTLKNRYDEKLADLESKSSHQYDGEVLTVNRRRELEKIQSDQQKKKLAEVFADSTVSQANFHDEQMEVKQKEYQKMLGEERLNYDKVRANDVSHLQAQLSKESIAHQEKLVDTIGSYEKQLTNVRNDYEKKLRRQGDLFREQTNKQVKGIQMDREATEMKLQARMNQMKENYENELTQLRKRQAAERQELATKKS